MKVSVLSRSDARTNKNILRVLKFIRRIAKQCVNIVAVFIAVPIVLCLKVLSPLVDVRFGYFFVDRIGHFAFDLEYYFSKKKQELMKKETVDIFFTKGRPCNETLVKVLNRELHVHPMVFFLFEAERIVFGGRKNLLPARINTGSQDPDGIFSKAPQGVAYFLDNEEALGEQYLRNLGCNGEEFVCLIVRDAEYLRTIHGQKNWDYHSYRDTSIVNYAKTIEFLVEKGYWVFRMGKSVNSSVPVTHPNVVDYAISPDRSDFLDIWLLSRCSFCISTSTGLDSVADAFRKPIAFVNFLPLPWFQTWSHCVLAPANLLWASTDRKLNCSEYLQHSYIRTEHYLEAGIRVEQLSSDEILAVVVELEARLVNKWPQNSVAEHRQQEFWDQFRTGLNRKKIEIDNSKLDQLSVAMNQRRPRISAKRFYHSEARLSSAFLQDNPEFLDKRPPQ